MRVLIVHSRYLSGDTSGENRVVADEANLLRQAGHDVWVRAPAPAVGGVPGKARAAVSAVWSPRAAAWVTRMIRRHAVDVVHVHNLFPMLSPSVLRAAEACRVPIVMTLHNYRLMCLPGNLLRDGEVCEACLGRVPWRGIVYRCYRDSTVGSAALAASLTLHRGLGSFDSITRFLAVSEFVKRKHVEAGIGPHRILVKPNFSWPVRRREGPGEYFLFLGRLAPEKGVDVLLDAWRVGQPPGRLVIVGDGPQAIDLRRLAPAEVEFRSSVPAAEVPDVLARARALLVPSRWYEPFSRTTIEAYGAGVPVVASEIGDLPELVQAGVTGSLLPPGNPQAWAEEAHRLTDDAESERLGRGAARLWSERYSPQHGLGRLEEAYGEAMTCLGR